MSRIIQLPAGLSPTDEPWLAALVQRTQANDTRAQVFLAKNYAFNGQPTDSYLLLASQSRFAWAGTLTADFLASAAKTAVTNTLPALPPEVPTSSPFPLVAGLAVQLTGPDTILDDVTDFDALAGALLVFVDNEVMSISAAELTAAGAYMLTVVRGFFGTTIADHLTGADVHIARRSDVVPFTHPSFRESNAPALSVPIGGASLADVQPLPFIVGDGTSIGGQAPAAMTFTGAIWFGGNDATDFLVEGTGFALSGINALKADDGAGHVFPSYAMWINGDTEIHVYSATPISFVATYTVYYSTNGGATWVSTGQSFTTS